MMKAVSKIIIAGAVGTTIMTLYSYYRSKKERQQYVEPVLLNKLINRSKMLPATITDNHPAGWAAHYGAGILFVTMYYILCRNTLQRPTPVKSLAIGSASGIIAVAMWETTFILSPNPPANNRYGYYRQLFIAHIVFTCFALAAYRMLDRRES